MKRAMLGIFLGDKISNEDIWVRSLETKEGSYQGNDLWNVTGTRHCQLLLSHSINTSLKNFVKCFQELGPRRRTRVTDGIERIAKLRWQWVGYIGTQDKERWIIKITIWKPRKTKK